MANYVPGKPNIPVDFEGEFSPSNLVKLIQGIQANADTHRLRVLQEAQAQFQMDTAIETKNMRDAYLNFSQHGLDWQAIDSGDPDIMFGGDLPDYSKQLGLMTKSGVANNTGVDQVKFREAVDRNNALNWTKRAKKFAGYAQAMLNQPYANEDDVYAMLRDTYHGDNVHQNLMLSGYDYGTASALMGGYAPKQRKGTWGEWWKSWVKDPDIVTPEGVQTGSYRPERATGVAGAAAITAYGGNLFLKHLQEKKVDFNKLLEMPKAERNKITKFGKEGNKAISKLMEDKRYLDKLQKLATPKQKDVLKNAINNLTDKIKKQEDALTKKLKKSRASSLKSFVAERKKFSGKYPKTEWLKKQAANIKRKTSGGPKYLAPMAGEAVGSIFGDTTEKIGQTAGTAYLANKVAKTSGKTFLQYLASKAPSIAAKAGVIAMADSPVVPVMDLVALGWTGIEIGRLYKKWRKGE